MKVKENINIPITDISNYFVVSDFDRTIQVVQVLIRGVY